MNVAQCIIETLADAGVRHLYGIPGDAINSLVEAIRQQDRVRFIQVRHEEAAALAASAEAKLTGRLTACVGTAGPGALHLLNGVVDARKDRAPVLAITGQVERTHMGSDHHQEVDVGSLFKQICEFSAPIVHADQAPHIVEQAARIASMHRTPCHLSLPADVATDRARREPRWLPDGEAGFETTPATSKIEEAAGILNQAERPVILAGVGALSSRELVVELAGKLRAPVIKTLPAKELVPDDHPLSLGGLGLLGTRPALNAIEGCDLLLMVGTDFPYEDFFPDHDRVIQIDSEPAHLGRRHGLRLGLVGHARPTLRALLPRIESPSDRPFLLQHQAAMRAWRDGLADLNGDDSVPLRPQRVAHEVGEAAPDDAIFVCDTGSVTVWAARHLRIREQQRFTLSSNLASMAYALPGALGAQLAYPRRPVVALAGDGGFSMLMSDFSTAVKYDLPIVVIVFNNGKLGLIQMEQEVEGYPEHQTDLQDIDFARFAQLCGGEGWRVEEPQDLAGALSRAFSTRRPTVLDVQIVPDEKTMPPRVEFKQAVQFGVAKVREFLGQG